MANIFAQLDAQLDQLFAGWNVWSTTLVVVLLTVLISPVFFRSEPDIHPFLLARQSNASPVRQSGESAVYRSLDIPHGYPLRSGLNIKDDNTPRWGPGRDGDLRDIWRRAVKDSGQKAGKILTLRGNRTAETTTIDELSKQVNIIGKHVQNHGGTRVAILLPNSTEFLVALFACAFYGLTPILIPTGISPDRLQEIMRQTQPDVVVAPGGVLSVQDLAKAVPKPKCVIWVTSQASQHLEALDDSAGSKNSSEWHKLIAESNDDGVLPVGTESSTASNVLSVWQVEKGRESVVEYTQGNVIASVAAQLVALPQNHALRETDLVVSLESWTQLYPLSITLAALYTNASIAITSSAGPVADYALAFQGEIRPSVIIASATTMSKAHGVLLKQNKGLFQNIHKWRHGSTLAAGTMRVAAQQSPRLIYVSAGAEEVPLSSQDLNDLRIVTGSRIVRSLIVPEVAGAVAQTSPLDYRINTTAKSSHFGSPLSCVEIKLVEGHVKISDEDYQPVGELVLAGPAVAGKSEAKTGVTAKIGDDQTLQLV